MQLLIFPGGGSPHTHLYSAVYALLEQEAGNYGYDGIDGSITWPGQILRDDAASAALTLHGAQEVAAAKIVDYESRGIAYDLLGRSFGCLVAAQCAVNLKPKHLRKIKLWGPSAFWMLWQKYARDLESNREICRSKGLIVDETYFPSLVPFESLICHLDYHTVIATGTKDNYSSPAYLDYLRSITASNNLVTFRMVQDAPHEVTKDLCETVVKAYLDALLA